MTIKELAHAAQRDIQAASGSPFSRSHVYELIAATLGFGSHAALCADHVMEEGARRGDGQVADLQALAHRRALALGLSPQEAIAAATVLAQALASRGVCARHLDDLVSLLRQDRGLDAWEPLQDREGAIEGLEGEAPMLPETPLDDRECSVMLRESLERAAAAGDHRASYALALLLGRDEEDEPEGSAHWHRLQQEGRVLDGVEKEWADAWARSLEREGLARAHLERAAGLGNPHALLDVAERRGDAALLQRAAGAGADPGRLAELAFRIDPENARYWLTRAAEAGEIGAMRTLVSRFDQEDLQRCWTWVHLAKLLGTDLTKDDMGAYHDGGPDDGQPYDDDVGGPMYVDGIEGVDLHALSPADDRMARDAAALLFGRISST